MFSGGDYSEVGRWLWNFVEAHAKRENLRVEALVDAAGAREGKSYGVRLRLAERLLPPADQAALEMTYRRRGGGQGPARLVRCARGARAHARGRIRRAAPRRASHRLIGERGHRSALGGAR